MTKFGQTVKREVTLSEVSKEKRRRERQAFKAAHPDMTWWG